jgi:hypothetical protein
MEEVYMDILLFSLSIASLFFISLYWNTRKRLIVLIDGFEKLYIANQLLRSIAEEKPTKEEEDIHKENFIKFLSDSREWAYEYIENVQGGIKKFIKEVGPEIDYYNNYGSVVEGMISPHDKALKTISKEFEDLKKLLPEETSDRR